MYKSDLFDFTALNLTSANYFEIWKEWRAYLLGRKSRVPLGGAVTAIIVG